jgi:aspartate beta-hydroxylase
VKPLYEIIGDIVRRIYDMRIEGPPVLDVATNFPSAEKFSCAWQSIRDEARAVAQQMHRVPRFHEIMCASRHRSLPTITTTGECSS